MNMLVKWSSHSLLLAYMVDKEDNAVLLSRKLESLIDKERSSGLDFNLCVSIVRKRENIAAAIKRLSSTADELCEHELRLI